MSDEKNVGKYGDASVRTFGARSVGLRKFFDALFLAAAAYQDATIFLGDDVAVQALQHHFVAVFGMHHAIVALVHPHIAHAAVAVAVL